MNPLKLEFPGRRAAAWLLPLFVFSLAAPFQASASQEAARATSGGEDRETLYREFLDFSSMVSGGSISPRWMNDGSSFWYAAGTEMDRTIYRVDPPGNTRKQLFDTRRLRSSIAGLIGYEPPFSGIPFETFRFGKNESTAIFSVGGVMIEMDLSDYTAWEIPSGRSGAGTDAQRTAGDQGREQFHGPTEVLSPDGLWYALESGEDLAIRPTRSGDKRRITIDGEKDYSYSIEGAAWSPDCSRIAAMRNDNRDVHHIPLLSLCGAVEQVDWVSYAKSGGNIPEREIRVVDVFSGKNVRIDTGSEECLYRNILGWREKGKELLYIELSRKCDRLSLRAADPVTGSARTIVEERSETFVCGLDFLFLRGKVYRPLEEGGRFLWMSERDGFNQIYLYGADGNMIRRLTGDRFPVIDIVRVDEKEGWVYYTAHPDASRPYDDHLFRVSLEGKSRKRLTHEQGNHMIDFSPSGKFFIDTYSTVTRPPRVELRSADGSFLQLLSEAGIGELERRGWTPPEEFTVTAADSVTTLHGVIFKPCGFDRDRKYPVIDFIYGGPFTNVVPCEFELKWVSRRAQALAQLGFTVIVLDGRGTPGRGKRFQDMVYMNLGRIEIPDHASAVRQLGRRFDYVDTTRVGITGYSYGGYFTIRAMLLAPDVFHVGFAGAPVADLLEHPSPAEPYIGKPQDNPSVYEYASNILMADRLKGRLMITVSIRDTNAPFSATLRMIDALMHAGKYCDLLLMPGQTHVLDDTAEWYFNKALGDFFVKHLGKGEN